MRTFLAAILTATLTAPSALLAAERTIQYSYDAAGRLLSADYGTSTIFYRYDPAGNLTGRVVTAAPVLLLSRQRVAVSVTYSDPYTGKTGSGTPIPQKDEFGYFYFYGPGNPEVFAKVLDFETTYAVFFSVLSDYGVTATFTNLDTGQSLVFAKPVGPPAGDFDSVSLKKSPTPAAPAPRKSAADTMPTQLLLSQSRVSVEVTWKSQYTGQGGTAFALPQQDQFGFFTYGDPSNPEVFVKVLDFETTYAVLIGALTDYEYHVTVKVLRTGQTKTFDKPPGAKFGFADSTNLLK
jgi:hypothetical protein